MWQIRRYEAEREAEWNGFVAEARNTSFLFRRGYMDYHSDRFADHSLLAYKNGTLRAVLPANITADNILHSHQGLTYGGWLLPKKHIDTADVLELWNCWLDYCRSCGITSVDYKPLPWVYASQPSQEDIYALFRFGATQSACLVSTAICLADNQGFNSLRRRQLRKASEMPFEIVETTDTESFMALVAACLGERYGASPVHTAAEMELLRSRFPDNIRMFVAVEDGAPQAGVMIYDTGVTAHCQYIATTALGREHSLLVPLFDRLINDVFAHKRFFDFGTSNEDGSMLNASLLRQKASFGGSAVVYPRYSIPVII